MEIMGQAAYMKVECKVIRMREYPKQMNVIT